MGNKKSIKEKLNKSNKLLTIGVGAAAVVGAGGLVTGWYLAGSNRSKIDDLESQMAHKSDVDDDIIDIHDVLSYAKLYGAVPIIKYDNEETKQRSNIAMVTVDQHANTLEYKNKINVLARLIKRGEQFIGTLHSNREISYTFFKIDREHGTAPTPITTIKFASDADGSEYKFATTDQNDSIELSVERGCKMYKDGVLVAENKIKLLKKDIFPSGSVPSVGVTFDNASTLPTITGDGAHEILRIDYKVHVGYAFNRAIDAGKAVYDYLDARLKVLEGHTSS